jgi:hypothetical protein
MKRFSLLVTIALVGFATITNLPAQLINPASLAAVAADPTTQQRINGTYVIPGQTPAIAAMDAMKDTTVK